MFYVFGRANLFVIAWLFAACANLPVPDEPLHQLQPPAQAPVGVVAVTLPPAALPRLKAGDTFFYGRTSVRQIKRVSDGLLEWTMGDTSYTSSAHFFTPLLSQDGYGSVSRSRIEGDPGQLWPLAAGKSVLFKEHRVITLSAFGLKQNTIYQWECKVIDSRMSYVPAGDFKTYHVYCEGRSDSFLHGTERRTWDYAPSMGHYVRRSWTEAGRKREATLSAALPAVTATPARIKAVSQRLASP